jgi:leucyl-tRNA synthetase
VIRKPAGGAFSGHEQPWPSYDPSLAADDTVTLVIQVNGRVRDCVTVPVGISDEEAREQAMRSHQVERYLNGRAPGTFVIAPDRLVNVVV